MKLLKLVPDNTNIDFMGIRNIALILSVLVTIAALVLVGMRGLNLGVDFVGGQMVRTTFAQPVDVEQLRSRIGSLGLGEANIQEFGGPTSFQIRLPKPEGGEASANAAATQTGASTPNPAASPNAPSTGPAAAPRFNAAVAYEPPIVGAADAAYSTRVIKVLPMPNDRKP